MPADPLRALLARNLRFTDLEEAPIPLRIVTTDLLTGEEVLLGNGGASNNVPISHAIGLGASTVYVLPTGYTCALTEPPRGALATALRALTLVLQPRLATDVSRYAGAVDLHVVPPLCPLKISPLDFRHTGSLIARARDSTRAWLTHPTTDLTSLSSHQHE